MIENRREEAEGNPGVAPPGEAPPPRRGRLSRRVRWALWSCLWAAWSLLLGAAVVRLSADIEKSPDFSLERITIEGCERVEVEIIRSVCGVELGTNLLAIDSHEVSRKLESCPLVESATVVKQFPRSLLIRIRERQPVVLFPHRGAFYCMDRDGVVFSKAASGDLPDLPLLTGLEDYPWAFGGREEGRMVQSSLRLLQDLSRVGAFGRLSEIHVDPGEGLSFFLEAFPVRVRIGWDPFGDGIRRLERVLPLLIAAPKSRLSIDVRYAGHVFVKDEEKPVRRTASPEIEPPARVKPERFVEKSPDRQASQRGTEARDRKRAGPGGGLSREAPGEKRILMVAERVP